MQLEDIPAVMKVEKESFSSPWPGNAYRRELKENRLARYIVARRMGPPLEDELRSIPEEPVAPVAPRAGLSGAVGRALRWFSGAPEPAPASEILSRRVVGYAGLWLMVDEAHITAIAVAPPYRGFGIGELLMLGMADIARDIGAHYLTLEVRASNTLAQNLYRKYGFKETGVRRRYYSDNNEDAVIMWSDPVESPAFRKVIEEHRRALLERLKSPQFTARLRSSGAQS